MRGTHLRKSEDGLEDGADSLEAHHDRGLPSHALSWCSSWRDAFALVMFIGVCVWFWVPLVKLFVLASENEHYSHVLLIPALTFYLLFMNRTAILTSQTWCPVVGLLVMVSGAVGYQLTDGLDWTENRLAVAIIAFVVMCWGLFLMSFGARCFRLNLFILMMLLFMVPVPSFVLDVIVGFLQRNSADAVSFLFSALGIPVLREGFIFKLSNFTIVVAEECSGIRSFLSLGITSLVTGYWFLTSGWARATLVVVVVPLAIIKNAFRIVGLALLANYVDPVYITDSMLHRSGGIPLFLLSLVVLFGVVWFLRRCECRLASTIV